MALAFDGQRVFERRLGTGSLSVSVVSQGDNILKRCNKHIYKPVINTHSCCTKSKKATACRQQHVDNYQLQLCRRDFESGLHMGLLYCPLIIDALS